MCHPVQDFKCGYFSGLYKQCSAKIYEELGYKVGSRFRELMPAVRGSQEARSRYFGLTILAHLCRQGCVNSPPRLHGARLQDHTTYSPFSLIAVSN